MWQAAFFCLSGVSPYLCIVYLDCIGIRGVSHRVQEMLSVLLGMAKVFVES